MEHSNDDARRQEQRRRRRRASSQGASQATGSIQGQETRRRRRPSDQQGTGRIDDTRSGEQRRVRSRAASGASAHAAGSAQGAKRRRRPSDQQASQGQGRPQRTRSGQGQRRSAPQRGQNPQRRSIQGSRRVAAQHASRTRGAAHARPSQAPSLALIACVAVGVVIVGALGWFIFGIVTRFDVTVNGEKVTLDRGSTIQTVLDKGLVSPKPGNLLAVDGSLLEKGKGAVCTATVDGKKAKVDTPLAKDNVVKITDGGDLTEKAKVTEEKIPYENKEGDRSFEAYWYGSIHLLSNGVDGVRTVTTGKKSGKTVDEVTKAPINAGYRIYTAKPEDKVIALTFDDGPWPKTTEQILDILDEYGAKATFFTIGEQISQTEDSLVRAYKAGHQICTHTWDHAAGSGGGVSISSMSSSEQIEEIQKGYDAIAEATGKEPSHVIRAPGGNFYGDVIDNVWDLVDAEIGWDVDTEDWSRPGADSIAEKILTGKSGQVVLMHDGGGDRSQTVEALKTAMPKLVEKGFKFVTVDELLSYGMPTTKNSIPSTTDGEDDEGDADTTSSDDTTSDSEDVDA